MRFQRQAVEIKDIRENFALTQKQLAVICGCTTQFIYKVETGLAAMPLPMFKKVMKKLGIGPYGFIDSLVEDYNTHLEKKLL